MSDMDFSLVGTASSESTGQRYFSSFGRVKITQQFKKWENGAVSEITKEQYIALPKSRKEANGGPYGVIGLVITLEEAREIALEAGKPENQAFDYTVRMDVGGVDYNNNLIPALEELRRKPFSKGKEKRAQEIAEALSGLQGLYVESLDVPQMKWDSATSSVVKAEKEAGSGRYWRSFYPVTTFKNRAECVAACAAKAQGKSTPTSNGTSAAPAPVNQVIQPDNFTPEEWQRAIKTIHRRLGRGNAVEDIAADLEIDPKYVSQFAIPA